MIAEKIFGATLGQKLTNATAFPWKGQWGYMAMPQVRRNQTGETTFVDNVYPVARIWSEDYDNCQPGTYTNLCPDQRYKSLFLVEAIGEMAMTPNPGIPERRGINFSQNFAVKVWINYEVLAVESPNEAAFAMDVIREFHGKKYKNISNNVIVADTGVTQFYINKAVFRLVSEMEHTPEAVFGAYTFSKDQGLFREPYGFFGLVFNMSGLIISDCALEDAYRYDTLDPC